MKGKFTLVLAVVAICFGLFSCGKRGCTDPRAKNYEKRAERDDNSCLYASSAFVGEYAVTDTTYSGYGDTIYQNYDMRVVVSQDSLHKLKISNFLNLRSSKNTNLIHDASVKGSRFYVSTGFGLINGLEIDVDGTYIELGTALLSSNILRFDFNYMDSDSVQHYGVGTGILDN